MQSNAAVASPSPLPLDSRSAALVLAVLVAVALWIPLTDVEWFASHEHGSYVLRTVEWAAELKRGALYPRWCPDFYGGWGSPFFVFYAPGVYAAAGLLTAVGAHPITALKLVALGASMVAAVGTYGLVHGETRRPDAALVATVAYLAAPYRIADLFARGDLAEFTCIALLPGAIALYRRAAFEVDLRRATWTATAAAVAHASLVLTHTILGLWGTAVIGVVVAGTSGTLLSRRAFPRASLLGGAYVAALLLASIYVVPALAHRDLVRIADMVVANYDPRNHWISVHDLFRRGMQQVGPLVLAALVATLLATVRARGAAVGAVAWCAGALALVCLTLPEASGLWKPGRLPFAAFVQFPWRLLGPAALAAAVALGSAWAIVARPFSPDRRWAAAYAVAAAMLLLLARPHAQASSMPSAAIPSTPELIAAQVLSTTGVDEYLPRAVSAPPSAPRRSLLVGADRATLEASWSRGSQHALTVVAMEPDARVSLGLHAFPGWAVETSSGPASAELVTGADGRLTIELSRAGRYRLLVRFGASGAVALGTALSIFACLATWPLLHWLAGRALRPSTRRGLT